MVEVLRRAARDAVRRGSSDGAATFLKRALAEPPAAGARGRGACSNWASVETSTDGPAAGEDLQAAYETLEDDDERATAAVSLTRTLVFVGDFGSPVRFAAAGVGGPAATAGREPRAAVLAYQRVAGQMHGIDPAGWDFDHRARRSPATGTGRGCCSRAWRSSGCAGREPRAGAVELAAASLADGQLVTVDPGLSWVWSQVVLDLADDDAVLPNWDAINADAHRRGSLFSVLAVGFWRAWSLMRRGDLARGRAGDPCRARAAGHVAVERDHDALRAGHAGPKILFDQGRADEAWAAVGDLTRAPTPIDGDRLLWTVRAEMLFAEGCARRRCGCSTRWSTGCRRSSTRPGAGIGCCAAWR